jgi:adenine-specific DNA-methyltransferase
MLECFFSGGTSAKRQKIVGAESPVPLNEEYPTDKTEEGYQRIYPINSKGEERVWRSSFVTGRKKAENGELIITNGKTVYQLIDHEGKRETLFSNWTDSKYNAGIHGSNVLSDLGLGGIFAYPKSIYTLETALWALTYGDRSAFILDYFAGSGTTGHAVINLNREDDGNRKYILVEMGNYFDTVLKPRIQKVIYSKDWKDGKPVSREGSSHLFKYIYLESYEDTLNNLEIKRTEAQQSLLEKSGSFLESYMLSYMLDVESRGSLLKVKAFKYPFNYKLNISTGSVGETKPVAVDLVETFNYLIGLTVKHIDTIRGIKVIEGTNSKGQKVLVLWRKIAEMDNDKLDAWFNKQGYNTKDMEYDLIYVNGDNNLENLRREDMTWKVRLIEEEFHRLMFDVRDV